MKLYSIRGVQEYWIVDRQLQEVMIFRRDQAVLKPVTSLHSSEQLTSPLLPGFVWTVADFFL
ncbi:MAG: hypothetical protein HC921_09995 [Synechococcaceae cyanobacterium SM2_3_1]|nr:hypothetical protein [Synechococcaceae cyanobacterium SM2_3_1]